MDRRRLALSLACLLLVPFVWAAAQEPGQRPEGDLKWEEAKRAEGPITVIVVRHAEKATDDPRDPSLSEAGRKRAEALARLCAHAAPSLLVASEFKRTQQTLAPLAERSGASVTVHGAKDVEGLAKKLRDLLPGRTAVVAGHSNTVPQLVQALGGRAARLESGAGGEQIPDGEYGRLYVLTLAPDRPTSVLELAYGE